MGTLMSKQDHPEHLLALKEADINYGRVEVDELENKHLENQVVIEFRLSSVHL